MAEGIAMIPDEAIRLVRRAAEFERECARDTRAGMAEFDAEAQADLTRAADEMDANGDAFEWCADIADRYGELMPHLERALSGSFLNYRELGKVKVELLRWRKEQDDGE